MRVSTMRAVIPTFALAVDTLAATKHPARDAAERPGANRHRRLLDAELGDRSDDDRVNTQHPPDCRRRLRIGAVAVREVLLLQHLVERLTLDDGIGRAFEQLLDHQLGQRRADVLAGAECLRRRRFHSGGVEAKDGDALLLLRCRRIGKEQQRKAYEE